VIIARARNWLERRLEKMAGRIRWLVPFRDEVVTSAVERLQSSLREHRIDIDSYRFILSHYLQE